MTDKQTAQTSRVVHWLTPYPSDQGLASQTVIENGPWQITPHWALIDGRAVIVGLDIRSFVEAEHDCDDPDSYGQRDPVDPSVGLAEVTQQVLRSVSISQIRQDSAEHIADGLRRFSASLVTHFRPSSPLSDWAMDAAEGLTASGQPRKRRPPAGRDLLARVADIYQAAVASGDKAPAAAVEKALRAEGVSISTKGGRDQVRKWVQRARQKGLLPPAR